MYVHPMTRLVMQSVPLLEFEQFRHVDDRDRLNDIRALAQDQITDDIGAVDRRERIGSRGRAYPADPSSDVRDDELFTQLWPERTDEQLDRAEGLEPFLNRLTGDQRIVVRMRYGAQMTLEEMAGALGIAKQSVHERLQRVHNALRKMLLAEFVPEVTDVA